MLHLVERDRDGVETLTRIRYGMKIDVEQPHVFKAMHKVLAGGAKSTATKLLQLVVPLKQAYRDLCEMPGSPADQILADKLRGAMYGVRFAYIRSRNNPEDMKLRRQVMQFGIASGKRDGMYVEFAYVFVPEGEEANVS
ncbi:hypothetical protein D3C85_964190 [compost metagenome]